jgi:nucleotide-binding universal stress UspA family protein
MSELIVVGIDGSPDAARALEQAAQDAARRGATLRVVSVARMPEVLGGARRNGPADGARQAG